MPVNFIIYIIIDILSPLVGRSTSHVRNSAEFSTFIAGLTLPPAMTLVSFDVVSLFTKVPTDLAAKVAKERLLMDPSLPERTALSTDEVVNLLTFCLNATYLSFRGEWYQQTFGTAMGSPVSVTVADLVMEDVEERALSACTHKPLFWKRYVDDTLSALPLDQIQAFHHHLNSIEPSIQFTIEEESLGTIAFLDTMVTRHDDGSLSTTVFRKKTHADCYLDFSSHHPLAYKVAVTRTLLTRADRICTFPRDKDAEKEHVSKALESNGYPKTVIHQHWRPSPTPAPPPSLDMPKATITLPYVCHLAESIRRILVPLNVRVCFRPHRTLRQSLVQLKDRTPPEKKAGVVYRIPCGTCGRVYIGQTGRTFDQRLKEHKRALTSGNPAQSAVAEHAMEEMYAID